VIGAATVALPKILNITVPQVGHLPLMALRPFFMISSTPSQMVFFALHLTQYPSVIKKFYRRNFFALKTTDKITGNPYQGQS
jgi:hypothetical protein